MYTDCIWREAKGIWFLLHSISGADVRCIVKSSTELLCELTPKAMDLEQLVLLQGNCCLPHLLSLPCLPYSLHAIVRHFLHRRQLIMEVAGNTKSSINDGLVVYLI